MTKYHEYIQLDRLLALQRPRTKYPAEVTFIIAHQIYELWFKLVIMNLVEATKRVDTDDLFGACRHVGCVTEVERLMVEQLCLLEHMEPHEFARVRESLSGISAIQSEQFVTIERLSKPGGSPASSDQLVRDLWTAFCDACRRTGLPMPSGESVPAARARSDSLERIYCDDGLRPLRSLAELMIDHDEGVALWRHRHWIAAHRQIGNTVGTGGSSGVQFLEGRLKRRFYPELWDVRTSRFETHSNIANLAARRDRATTVRRMTSAAPEETQSW